MDDDGEEDKPVDDCAGDVEHVILFLVRIFRVRKEMTHVFAVKHGSHTNRSKVAHKESFLHVLDDLGHQLVQSNDGRDTSENEDHEAETEQSANGDTGAIGIVELSPGNGCSNKHESTKVQKNIQTVVDLIVSSISLGKEVSIPVEEVPSDEASDKVVCADSATGSDDEKADGDREEQVGLLINPAPACNVSKYSL